MTEEVNKVKDIDHALSEIVEEASADQLEVPMFYDGDLSIKIRDEFVWVVAQNYREGFNFDEFKRLYEDYFAKYDYIVGDWAHEKLRLRGFYQVSQKSVPKDRTIDFLDDYLKEYCNFGCAYFVLAKEEALQNFDEAYENYLNYISKAPRLKDEKVYSTRGPRKRKQKKSDPVSKKYRNDKSDRSFDKKMHQKNDKSLPRTQTKSDNFQINKKSQDNSTKHKETATKKTMAQHKAFTIKKKEQ